MANILKPNNDSRVNELFMAARMQTNWMHRTNIKTSAKSIKMLDLQVVFFGCLVFISLLGLVRSVPQPVDMIAEVRQGSGKFIVLACVDPVDCSDITFLVTGLPSKGQLFRAKGSPNQPLSTFERSDAILITGVMLSNRIVYYLPFHEVSNSATDAVTIVSDAIKYKADAGSNEARCVIEILRQPLLPIGGGSGYSLLFDGVDDIVAIEVESWFPNDAFTVMLWIRVYDGTKHATLFSFFGDEGPAFEVSNPLNLTCIVGFSPLSPSNIDVSDGKWHHVTVTWSSSSMACQFIVDANISAVAFAPSGITPNMKNVASLVLGNRQACHMHNNVEQFASDTQLRAQRTVTAIPIAGNREFNFSTATSALLSQHVMHRAHGRAAPVAISDDSLNSRQRTDYLLCRCAGGCFHSSLAFGGEMDDFRLYSFEKTMPEIRVESKFVFQKTGSNVTNKTRPQQEQQFFGLQLWLTFDDIVGVKIADSSGQNRNAYRGSSTKQRFPCHKKREPFQVVSSTGVLGGSEYLLSIGAASRIEIKLPGIVGIGNQNETLVPRFRYNKQSGGGSFYHAACGYSGNLFPGMIVQTGSLVGPTGCLIYIPNQLATVIDVIEYSISNMDFPTAEQTDPSYVEITYRVSFFRESSVIPSNYMVGLQAETISVVKLITSRSDSNKLSVAVSAVPKYANVWIAIEGRCADIRECELPVNTMSWETSGSSFIDVSSLSKFSDWKYVRPPFSTPLYQVGPLVCNTTHYYTPELVLPSKVCKIGKYYLNNSIFFRPRQSDPLFLMQSKWDDARWELRDFSSLPYGENFFGGANANGTLQGVIVECLIYDGTYNVPHDNCTCCYISNCFPPGGIFGRVVEQYDLPSTPAAVLRAVLSQNTDKLEGLLKIKAPFDRSAINAAAALGNVDILSKLLDQELALWDYDAIELASSIGSSAAVDFLRSRTTRRGYEGKRSGPKCLVRGDSVASFTGFVTAVPYFLASAVSGVTGHLGSLLLHWSKPQLTDKPPNFPVSRFQNVSFWGLRSRSPRPDSEHVLKYGNFHGFQSEPIEIKLLSSIKEDASTTCVRTMIVDQPQNGTIYNLDDSFGFQFCKDLKNENNSMVINEIFCREFGEDVYFFHDQSNRSTFANNPIRPTVHPARIVTPVFQPLTGVKIRKHHHLYSQSPNAILNASSDNTTG
jgi:hypothetical protein